MKPIDEVPHEIRDYARGARAYYAGIPVRQCPLFSVAAEQWRQGWVDAAKREVQDELAKEFR